LLKSWQLLKSFHCRSNSFINQEREVFMAKYKLDVNIANVNEVYDGAGGILWEMLMGEQIHVGAEAETDVLARKAASA